VFERIIDLTEEDDIFIRDGGNDIGCGNINDDGHLYYINTYEMKAYQLPDKYKDTPICIYPSVGGLNENLIMVSLMGDVDLQYHHNLYPAAGLWGWLDLDGNEIISPQYIFAIGFYEGKAVVAKGEWSLNEEGEYWCNEEKWGVIDTSNREIIPCIYDEIYAIEDSDRYFLCHKGGWETGCQIVYDTINKCEITELDSYFDSGYMFNSCYVEDNMLIFDEHIPGGETDFVSVYSLKDDKWIVRKKKIEDIEFLGKARMVVEKDGKEIIVY